MELTLYREPTTPNYTEGELKIDGEHFCYTIEDVVRAKPGFWKKIFKIYAQTAIPYGRYEIQVTWSNKFKRLLPILLNVPDYSGIRLHNGTSALSSEGCIIVSYDRNGPGRLILERGAMNDLTNKIEAAQKVGKVYINII